MIDVIGNLFDPPLTEGDEPVQLPGWHVNVTPGIMAVHPALSAYVIEPSSLRRVWAGDDPANPVLTIALRFADEAAAMAALEGIA